MPRSCFAAYIILTSKIVRHCQGQAIADHWHGILHRIENDFRNSRLWYQNRVTDQSRSPYFATVEDAQKFVWDCQNVVVDKNSQGHDVRQLQKKAMDEVYGLLQQAIDEFGLTARADTSEYLSSTKVRARPCRLFESVLIAAGGPRNQAEDDDKSSAS